MKCKIKQTKNASEVFCLIRRNAVEINFFNVLAFKAKTKLKGYSDKVVIGGRNNFKSQKGF